MNELIVVCKTEIGRRLRSRLFWFGTIGGTLLIALTVAAPILLAQVTKSTTTRIILAGPEPLRSRAAKLLKSENNYNIVGEYKELPQTVNGHYLEIHKKAEAALNISEHNGHLRIDIYPKDLSVVGEIDLSELIPLGIEEATGKGEKQIARAMQIERKVHAVDGKFQDEQSATLAHGMAFGMIFVLYLSITIAAQSVMSAVAEEKTSRIAEILVATIQPKNLLAGKIIAAASAGLIQIGIWSIAALLTMAVTGVASGVVETGSGYTGQGQITAARAIGLALRPQTMIAFGGFFLLGYFEFASIYAAAASLISRTEDLGSVTAPVILPVVGAFFGAEYALVKPEATAVVGLSFVPFLSPFIMFARVAVSDVPWWQISLAVIINIITVGVAFAIAGRIYRMGMLLYGRPPSPKQILLALRG